MPDERFSLTVCPWTPENPRHDHQQIFPLRDGRLLLIWSEYYADRPSFVTRTPYSREGSQTDLMPCRLSAKLSADGGRSWTAKFTVQDNFATHNVKHPCLLRLPSGEILLFFTAWWSETERRVYVKRSADECETWSAPVQISESPGFYCINHDHALRLTTGRIVVPCFVSPIVWQEGEHFRAFCFYSDDDGHTWQRSENTMDLPGRGAEEPMVVELKDGSLYCILRSTLGKVFKAISRDGGVTWDDPAPTGLVSCESEAFITCIPSTGNLLMLWNNIDTPKNRPRNPLTAAVSHDEGATWSNFRDIENRAGFDSGYPAVTFVGDEALVTYYHASRSMARDCWLELKVYPVSWFYE
jgi:sialidase-1